MGRAQPTPFAHTTAIGVDVYDAGVSAPVLQVLAADGRLVRSIAVRAGVGHTVVRWDGNDDAGRPATPGVYTYRLADRGRPVSGAGRVVRTGR